MSRDIFKGLPTEFKQDYLNIGDTVAISSEGELFKIGDSVCHEGSENVGEEATITHFYRDTDSHDVIAHTTRGFGRISFMYHPKK